MMAFMAYKAGPPHDAWNGIRVGSIVGVIVGAGVAALLNSASLWLLVIGAAVGGVIGYVRERRRIRGA